MTMPTLNLLTAPHKTFSTPLRFDLTKFRTIVARMKIARKSELYLNDFIIDSNSLLNHSYFQTVCGSSTDTKAVTVVVTRSVADELMLIADETDRFTCNVVPTRGMRSKHTVFGRSIRRAYQMWKI